MGHWRSYRPASERVGLLPGAAFRHGRCSDRSLCMTPLGTWKKLPLGPELLHVGFLIPSRRLDSPGAWVLVAAS
jgi:hypothetical protein